MDMLHECIDGEQHAIAAVDMPCRECGYFYTECENCGAEITRDFTGKDLHNCIKEDV